MALRQHKSRSWLDRRTARLHIEACGFDEACLIARAATTIEEHNCNVDVVTFVLDDKKYTKYKAVFEIDGRLASLRQLKAKIDAGALLVPDQPVPLPAWTNPFKRQPRPWFIELQLEAQDEAGLVAELSSLVSRCNGSFTYMKGEVTQTWAGHPGVPGFDIVARVASATFFEQQLLCYALETWGATKALDERHLRLIDLNGNRRKTAA
jgi:glycine cleavage system regulatory protein